MALSLRALVALAILACASAANWRHVQMSASRLRRPATSPPWSQYNQTEHYYTGQRLDHFNTLDHRTWSQRYFVIENFWKAPHGPVILYICGEYTCTGINPTRLFPLELAYELGALVVAVEHRFYGTSQPFDNLATEHLQYLNSRQALNDLAQFSDFFQDAINARFGQTGRNQWISIGGSYPGALSAWYRYKFPHKTAGSLASSGVVEAILNYTAFDEQVARSAGPECAEHLRAVTRGLEQGLPGVKASFGAAHLSDDDFLLLAADSAAEAVQYGHRKLLCSTLAARVGLGTAGLVDAFANFTTTFFFGDMGASPSDYDSNVLADPKYNPLLGGRQWWFQVCTELAYFQVAPAQGSIRSQRVNLQYFRDVCRKLYGVSELPDVEGSNTYYGGSAITNHTGVTNIFFTNGVEDPWRWATVQQSAEPDRLPAVVIDCPECAHCVDLHTPDATDAPELATTRAAIKQHVRRWLAL